MKLRNAYQLYCLNAGSKNRLRQFRSNLKRNYDHRNFDKSISELLLRYGREEKRAMIRWTMKYLRNLKSKKDGKLFSQGVKEYRKLEDAADRFAQPNHAPFRWNRHYKAAKEMLLTEFRKLHFKPIAYSDDESIVRVLPKLDTHAGFEYILSGKKEKGENLEDIARRFAEVVAQAKLNGSFGYPLLPATRTQGSGHAFDEEGNPTHDCDHKTRMVAMVALMVIIAELMFAKPIQEYMATTKWYAGGKNLDADLSRIITGMRTKYRFWVSLDYSSFDQSVSAWLIQDAFEIVSAAFDMTDDEREVFKLVEHDFIHKDFVMGDRIVHSDKGVPSGSMFTQIVDSIVNRLIILTYLGSTGNVGEMVIMGDDNLVYTLLQVDPMLLASYVKKNFGMIISGEKTKSGTCNDHPTFLSCQWWPEGRFREPRETIGKMLYPERARVYGKNHGTPEQTLWSYCLMYPITMDRLIDVRRFLNDNPRVSRMSLHDMDSQLLPGFLKYVSRYTYGYWSTAGGRLPYRGVA